MFNCFKLEQLSLPNDVMLQHNISLLCEIGTSRCVSDSKTQMVVIRIAIILKVFTLAIMCFMCVFLSRKRIVWFQYINNMLKVIIFNKTILMYVLAYVATASVIFLHMDSFIVWLSSVQVISFQMVTEICSISAAFHFCHTNLACHRR